MSGGGSAEPPGRPVETLVFVSASRWFADPPRGKLTGNAAHRRGDDRLEHVRHLPRLDPERG